MADTDIAALVKQCVNVVIPIPESRMEPKDHVSFILTAFIFKLKATFCMFVGDLPKVPYKFTCSS